MSDLRLRPLRYSVLYCPLLKKLYRQRISLSSGLIHLNPRPLLLKAPQPPTPSPQGTSTPGPFSSRHLNPRPLLLKAPQPPAPSPQGEGELRDAILSMCLLISCKTWSTWLNTCSFLNLITLIPNRPSYAVRFRSCSFVSSWS